VTGTEKKNGENFSRVSSGTACLHLELYLFTLMYRASLNSAALEWMSVLAG